MIKSAKNWTFDEFKSSFSSVFKNIRRRSVEVAAELSLPSWKNFKEFAEYTMKKALNINMPVTNIWHSYRKVQKLSSKGWPVKRAADMFVNEFIETL